MSHKTFFEFDFLLTTDTHGGMSHSSAARAPNARKRIWTGWAATHAKECSKGLTVSPTRRVRVGGWRIIFMVEDEIKVVAVVAIETRGHVYQRI